MKNYLNSFVIGELDVFPFAYIFLMEDGSLCLSFTENNTEMYILSKSIYFLINPIVWITALLALALLRKKNQRKYLKWGFFMFLFFSLAPIFETFAYIWEVPLTDMRTMEKEYDIGIVLGGFSKGSVKPFDRLHFTSSATRVTTAIELYQAGKIKKILVTGGSFSVQKGQLAEGERTRLFLEKTGIPPEDIIMVVYKKR